ncbi:hypothetical protein Vadar_001634 [Vaccinium darrowii]|uniref:Uncharacterized protein n=1 Tax=Vaccinium darrowii TaxID=229202 RepID=A0ACB7WWV4_9ERIC|nr:hypothetical protein Vadar_001634 [Vaccinium darrowii]
MVEGTKWMENINAMGHAIPRELSPKFVDFIAASTPENRCYFYIRVVSEERCDEVESLVLDLFANLGAPEEQLDFPVLYASAKKGWASSTFTKSPADDAKNMSDLLDAIVSMMEKDFYLGRILTGRVSSGLIRIGDLVHELRKTDSGVEKIEEGKEHFSGIGNMNCMLRF